MKHKFFTSITSFLRRQESTKRNFLFMLCFVILFSTTQYAFAEGDCSNTCKIQDTPAPVLEEYIDNVSKVVSNISKKISESEATTQTTKKMQSSILASMSQVINFSGYFSSFDFYVALPITQEVPYPIKRDHERINRENERLSRLLKRVTKNGYGEVALENVCDGVSNCNMSGSIRSVLTALLKNNKNITDFYRLSILDRNDVAEQKFILVPDNFTSEIQEYYNKETLTDCSQCEGGFMDRINESIESISSLNSGGSEGIRKWKDAWAQITGAGGQSTKTKSEDQIFKDYIGTQGIPADSADAVSDNLQKYNSGGLSASNPFSNSVDYTFTNAKRDINTFREGIGQYLDTDQEKIPIIIINKTIDKVETTQNIQNDIKAIYDQQLPFAAPQDAGTQKIVAKIIRMHYNLVSSINILSDTVKTSEKVCDSQGQGQGKCSYR